MFHTLGMPPMKSRFFTLEMTTRTGFDSRCPVTCFPLRVAMASWAV